MTGRRETGNGDAPTMPADRPGLRTTEFALSALIVVCATILLALRRITPTDWTGLVGAVGAAYGVVRTVVKVKA